MRPGNEIHNRSGVELDMAHVGEIIEREDEFLSGERGGKAWSHSLNREVDVVVSVKKRYVYEVRMRKGGAK